MTDWEISPGTSSTSSFSSLEYLVSSGIEIKALSVVFQPVNGVGPFKVWPTWNWRDETRLGDDTEHSAKGL